MELSPLQKVRYSYEPKLPEILKNDISKIVATEGEVTESVSDQDKIKALFPKTYGMREVSFTLSKDSNKAEKKNVAVILSGGQAPGGHNVITGLYDALKKDNKESTLIGFKNGPSGLLEDKYIEFTDSYIDSFRNTGGFDIIGSGRTKLETEEQFEVAIKVAEKHNLNAIVIIGGDDSNTNAAVLAEYFLEKGSKCQVIGCPKTIDGDLKNDVIEISFGFDTATKTYSELIGNIERDANSAKKYWHFIRVMGRSASHIALECALETQPNICFISEEVEKKNMSLEDIADQVVASVVKRSENGENFGVAIIPEGLIEFVPEVKKLISELNDIMAIDEKEFNELDAWESKYEFMQKKLTLDSFKVFSFLPLEIEKQLLMDRDPHGNVQVSRIETEKLIISIVEKKLADLKKEGKYKGKFSALSHFFGYEGRCAFPSNFDADYCYSLGYNAYMLLREGYTGYISAITNLSKPSKEWKAGGMPIVKMFNLEQRHGKLKPVIKKALVELDSAPFKYFAERRDEWAEKTLYTYPGAIQYYGPESVCDITTRTLALEQGGK